MESALPRPEGFDSAVLNNGPFSRLAVMGALLKDRPSISWDLAHEKNLPGYATGLYLVSFLLSAAYGAVLGLFQPGLQTLYAAAKLPIVMIGTALLCLPTFYVFNSILGSRLSFRHSLTLLLLMTAAASVILAAFAPIAWFFTVSTGGRSFLVALHVAFFLTSAAWALRFLESVRQFLLAFTGSPSAISRPFLRAWFVLVLFVGLQMAYSFRPFITRGPFMSGERGLFFDEVNRYFHPAKDR